MCNGLQRAIVLEDDEQEDPSAYWARVRPDLKDGMVVHSTRPIVIPHFSEERVWDEEREQWRRFSTNSHYIQGRLVIGDYGALFVETQFVHPEPKYDWQMSRKRWRLAGTPVLAKIHSSDTKHIVPGLPQEPRAVNVGVD